MRWIAALLLAVALSGCFGGEETTDPLDAESPDAPGPAAPGANLTALLDVTLPANATGPVVFTVDAPGAVDPGNASWNLVELGVDAEELVAAGTGVPATVNRTFPAGPHTVRLEVIADGLDANETRSFVVDAAGDAGEAVGNATGNATDATGAAGAVAHSFAGTMAANPDVQNPEVQTHAFQVADGVQALTVWAHWNLPVPMVLTVDSPQEVNLDVVLKDPSGAVAYEGATSDFEYGFVETTAAGTWTLDVVGDTVPEERDYTVDVLAWNAAPLVQTVTGAFVADAYVGAPGSEYAGDGPVDHAVTVPAGATTVAGRLTWNVPEGQEAGSGDCLRWDRTQDVDFEALLGSEVRFSSGNFLGCEFGFASGADELGGAWTFKVKPYQAADTSYTLLVFSA